MMSTMILVRASGVLPGGSVRWSTRRELQAFASEACDQVVDQALRHDPATAEDA